MNKKSLNTYSSNVVNYIKSNLLSILNIIVLTATVCLMTWQLHVTAKSNRQVILSKLYQDETGFSNEENTDPDDKLWCIWSDIPSTIKGMDYAKYTLGYITSDYRVLHSTNVATLYSYLYGPSILKDDKLHTNTKYLRRVFNYIFNTFYHLDQGFDAKVDGIINESEWNTWKGELNQMHAHPLLLVCIYQAHENNYISRDFSAFIQKQYSINHMPKHLSETQKNMWKRDCEFAKLFYPELTTTSWLEEVPNEKNGFFNRLFH